MFSFEIYILHLFLVVKIPQAGDWINSLHPSLMIPLQLLFATAVAAVAIALSVLGAKAIHKIPLLPGCCSEVRNPVGLKSRSYKWQDCQDSCVLTV